SLNERFVRQAYLDLIGTTIDPDTPSFLGGLLDRGAITRTRAVRLIERTTAYRMHLVGLLYFLVLRRQPSRRELAASLTFLQHGGTRERRLAVLFGRPEYVRKWGRGTAAAFLSALSRDLLGGPAGLAGVGDDTLLDAGGRSRLALQMMKSPKARENLVR